MRKVKAKELTRDSFAEYGLFANMLDPEGSSVGPKTNEFFFDRIVYPTASASPVGMSTSHVQKRPVVADTAEFHRQCGEVVMPIDGDVYIHVGQRTGDQPDFDRFEFFRVPKGTAVYMFPGTWHYAAFPVDQDVVNVLCLLPERTYANDCVVVEIPEEDQITLE